MCTFGSQVQPADLAMPRQHVSQLLRLLHTEEMIKGMFCEDQRRVLPRYKVLVLSHCRGWGGLRTRWGGILLI